jgi:hypothetical protein
VTRSKIATLTVLGITRTIVLKPAWAGLSVEARIAWLTSWANDVITDIVIDTDETRRDG